MAKTENQPHVPLHELLTKLWALFDQADRCRLLGILAFMLLGTLLEILGVGLIVPVVAVLSDPEAVQEIPQLRAIHESFGSPTPRTFLMWSLGGLLGVFVFKNLFLFVSYYIQFKFIFRKHADIAGRLLGSYLRRPYVFHLQKNTADLVRNISSELPSMISGFFIPAFLLVSESLVFLGLILLALLASPLITLVTTGLLGFALWLFYAAFRPRLAKWGKRVQQHGGEMIQQVQQGLGGIKEVKLFGCEEHVTKSFIRHAQGFTRNAGYHSTLSQSSRLVVETLMVGALLGVVIVLVSGTTQASIILPTLALYAAIAFRLMPSANRLIGAATSIRYTSRALEVIHADLTAATPSRKIPLDDATTLPFTHAIELHDVTFKYEASHQPALQKINLQIKHGTMVGFQGESGAGKTTLVDLVLGLIEPDAGQVLVDGLPINKNLPGWQRQIGYVPQSVYLTDDTLRRNIAFGLADADIDDDRVWQALQQAQLGSFIHEKPDKLETRVGEQGTRLSGGQLQRIGIARALYHNPDVLVLDEATAALDVKTEARFIEVIRFLKGKKTILIISHRLSTLRHCDEQHRLCQGRLETLKTAPNKALQI